MYFSSPKLSLLSAAVLLVSSVMADLHDSCTCHNGDSYNWRMTTAACTVYDEAKYQWGGTYYNSTTGRCTQRASEDQLGGNEWEDACKRIASTGFQCADGVGTCFANTEDIKGWC
ncbi:uncharacterized protein DNG_06267 [Cephalotrichum gorgonifer]|uniref:Uncharacterized protein n=1 Tax=Cephalotrichum gorgonifer TaxID=2041049 RepID=A0AAE8SWF8_9PEZI|nr:uncharacterized protein DNG_06267 [Cephalotrichum gorgonifer]